MFRLPAFSNLIAFDAVARHGTLTSAAAELNVSQPAVSRRIALLEADLGAPLFNRAVKPLALTANGEKLFDVLRSGLSRLEVVVDRIRNEPDGNSLTISAASGLAAYWLIPRLPAMQAAFPRISIRITSQSHSEDTLAGDLQIRFGEGSWPTLTCTQILGEEVFPVASPLFLKGQPLPLSQHDMMQTRLLDMQNNRHTWYDWETWFDEVGAPVTGKLQTLAFDSYVLLVSAALAGQGICLCWSGLLDTFLASGALVRLSELSATSSRGYFVTFPSEPAVDPQVEAVAGWLATTNQLR